jgi:hypothetical protein
MEQEAVSEGQKQDQIAPGFLFRLFTKLHVGQQEREDHDSGSAVSGMGPWRG